MKGIKVKLQTFMVRDMERTSLGGVFAPGDCARIAAAVLRGQDQDKEHFFVLGLDARYEVSSFKHISTGTVNSSLVHPREVFKSALIASCVAIVLVHNHPSGNMNPSNDDLALTQRMIKVGELLGITVLDHVIVSDFKTYSMREHSDAAFEGA